MTTITIANIQTIVANYFEINPSWMKHASRARRYARPRQIAMCLCREMTQLSLPHIGRHFGNRDHTTVLHATRAVNKRARDDDDAASELSDIRQLLCDVSTDYARGFADMCWQHGCSSIDGLRFPPEPKPNLTAELVWHRSFINQHPPTGWIRTKRAA